MSLILPHYKRPKHDLLRNGSYLRWIRSLPCCICGGTRFIEAAHVGERGMGQKCSDFETLPLCADHHRMGPLSHHVLGRKFWIVWGIDRFKLIRKYNEAHRGKENEAA
jgi:Protein of unknown function (DUF968)